MGGRDITQAIEAAVSRTGWFVQNVLPGRDTPSFSYTIGLTETFRHPELIMIAFRPELMQPLLNQIGELVRKGSRFGEWDRCDNVVRKFPVVFRAVPASEADNWALGAVSRYGPGEFELLQAFLPDQEGRFPWDEACDPRLAAMQGPLLPMMAARVS